MPEPKFTSDIDVLLVHHKVGDFYRWSIFNTWSPKPVKEFKTSEGAVNFCRRVGLEIKKIVDENKKKGACKKC